MALATQCPHCQTSFRVVHDQLKLRAGLVRCGTCAQIFNGVECLLAADNLPEPAPVSEGAAGRPLEPPEPSATSALSGNGAPPQRATLMDFAAFDRPADDDTDQPAALSSVPPAANNDTSFAEAEDAPEELDETLEDLQPESRHAEHQPATIEDKAAEPESPEPGFVQQARRRQRVGQGLQLFLRVGSFVLLVGLFAQTTYAFRNQIAAWLPQTAPSLVKACALLGCEVGLPAQIDAVSIESSELQAPAANQNTFALVTLLRNRSTLAQAWPSIELTLNDANEKAIARRVFSPREYLSSAQDLSKGFAGNSEQPVRISFELSQLKASGYRLYLFYL
jgi:predicted Zn finger-like uncharacterized protein